MLPDGQYALGPSGQAAVSGPQYPLCQVRHLHGACHRSRWHKALVCLGQLEDWPSAARSIHSACSVLHTEHTAHLRALWRQHKAQASSLVKRAVRAQAAGLTHIGYGPMKRENQDHVSLAAHSFGPAQQGSLFGVFDGHGPWGKPIASACSRLLPYFVQLALQEAALVGFLLVALSEAYLNCQKHLLRQS